MKIQVQRLDGGTVHFTHAFYRHSIDLGFSIINTVLLIVAFLSFSGSEYNVLDFAGKMELYEKHTPKIAGTIETLALIWIGSEMVVLFLNEKRRALHDFIAGTVVVHLRCADSAG